MRKRTDGCVLLRTALGFRLEGLQPNQVAVEVNAGGRWFPVGITGGAGSVATAQTSPLKPTLCRARASPCGTGWRSPRVPRVAVSSSPVRVSALSARSWVGAPTRRG
ncbi:hypothetical protein NKG94_28900 [Micromonospora sp. M12]